jgi:asparagine N-glycosylation enzyme membrane subunit Stt3
MRQGHVFSQYLSVFATVLYQGQVVFVTSAALHIPVFMGPLVVAPSSRTHSMNFSR